MKVLVTGGYGFIGSFVAERFYKEGYQVYILDNLSSGDRNNVDFKHKSFLFSVEDKKCEEVFRSNKFDVVVHLAAQINVQTSMEDPLLDSTSNILGLVNMLRLSSKHRVEKFIFASSAAVYGRNEHMPLSEADECDPISIYGMNKLIGEQYCHKWKEFYGLDTLCFRFANVYGPRQGSIGEGGVISTFLERLHTDQEIDLHGDGSQTRDFIYVEDVADAIYRAGTTDYSGVLNLSTNKQSSINELIGLLGEEKALKGINHSPKRKGDIDVSVLDNTRVKRRLDWVPMYSLREGLAKTSRWFAAGGLQRENEKRARTAEPDTARPSFVADIRPYVENLLAFLVVLALSVYTTQSGMFDLKLIYIVLISAIYGTKQSILSVILSCGLFIGESLHNGREIVSLLYDASVLFHIAIYFIIGIAVGYSMDKRSKEVVSTQFEKQAVEEKYDFLKEMYNDNLQVKDELQQQIYEYRLFRDDRSVLSSSGKLFSPKGKQILRFPAVCQKVPKPAGNWAVLLARLLYSQLYLLADEPAAGKYRGYVLDRFVLRRACVLFVAELFADDGHVRRVCGDRVLREVPSILRDDSGYGICARHQTRQKGYDPDLDAGARLHDGNPAVFYLCLAGAGHHAIAAHRLFDGADRAFQHLGRRWLFVRRDVCSDAVTALF